MASSQQHRCVFVGNIPYDATEEQLIQICEEVGPVVSFRLVIDRETGKPKGYGFCEYKDEETALSARRNLQGYEINGRQLRVDFAENDKSSDRNREQGRGGPGMVSNADGQKQVGGPAVGVDPTLYQPIGLPIAMTAASVMAGVLGGGQTGQMNQSGLLNQSPVGNDPLTHHLAKMSRSQLHQVIHEIKILSMQNKDVARQLLLVSPQLPKALFLAQIMLGMVTPQMLQMPNIRQQAPNPSLQPSVAMQVQQPATQPAPGLPPFAPLSSVPQSSMAHNQFPAPLPLPLQPRVHVPNLSQMGVPPQSAVPAQSGSLSLPPVHPQPLSGPLMQTGRPVQAPPLQHVGHASQLAVPNASLQSAFQARPVPSNLGNQAVSSVRPSLVETNVKDKAMRPQLTGDSGLAGRKHSLANVPSLFDRNDHQKEMGPPSKLVRLDDGRCAPRSSTGLATSTTSGSGPSNVTGSNLNAADQTSNVEIQSKQKQAPQLQLPPDVEPALLQQVLNLTPEQLSSLPPEQQQQVIQLQKMLR